MQPANEADAGQGVRYQRNVLIPLKDGVHLAADLCLPAAPGKYPVLMSIYPYQKDGRMGGSHTYASRYFAERGYASLLVDLRGTGSSGGLSVGNLQQESLEGAEAVEWAAAQEWCSGEVALWGISYGGDLSFSIAALRPPHLKAIVPVHGSWGRREDSGGNGCRRCIGTAAWMAMMLALDLVPPLHQDAEGRWMRIWRERLGSYERGGIRGNEEFYKVEDGAPKGTAVERIEVPTFLIGGWRDFFPQAMVDAFGSVRGPKKLLMGPWLHRFPDVAPKEPVDILREMHRFFDQWLKNQDTGITREPDVTVFVQGLEQWKHESAWPVPQARVEEWHLQPGHALARTAAHGDTDDKYLADPTVGTVSTMPDMLQLGVGYPREQAEDDLRSLTYTSAPFKEDVELTGSPEATLQVALEEGEELQLVARLAVVAPNGSSSLITTGWLPAIKREASGHSKPVERGVVEYRVPLWPTSYVVPAGHRLRLAIACSDFPFIWPLCTNPTIKVRHAGSFVRVPTVPKTTQQLPAPALPVPDPKVNRRPWNVPTEPPVWKIERDAVTGGVAVQIESNSDMRTASGASFRFHLSARATTPAKRPDAASVHCEGCIDVRMPNGERVEIRTKSHYTQHSTALSGEVTLDGVRLLSRIWN